MPIFSHRRLCAMLIELSGHLDSKKFNELKSRLNHVRTNTALAAEAELSVLWAISRVAHLDAEPTLANSSNRPDAASDDLFASRPSVIEIRALSDDSFSGREAMGRTANIIAAYADRVRKGAGKHLYFEFDQRSYWTDRFHRERCVDPMFKLKPALESQLRQWIEAPDWPNPPHIRLAEGRTDVIITWKEKTFPLFRTFCRMPAVAYDPEDNPIYKALRKKSRQIKGAEGGRLRCVVLVDAGCGLLRRLRPLSPVNEIGGEAIIRHALAKLSLDAVVVLSPHRQQQLGFLGRSQMHWRVNCYDKRETIPAGEYDRLQQMANQLPVPHLEGYQARDLHKQGAFAPNGGDWHLPTHTTSRNGGPMTIKLSAGLLHNYLAGRIDAERFQQGAFGNSKNIFELELSSGHSIRNVEFEPGGINEDDDYVVIDLDLDPQKIIGKAGSQNEQE